MANAGKNTNGSQFFLTFAPASWLDGKHVVFGRVESGYDICERIEKIPTNQDDKPFKRVVVSNCGELKREQPKSEVEASSASDAQTEEVKKSEDKPAAESGVARKESSSSSSRDSSEEKRRELSKLSKKIKKHKKKKHHKKHHHRD